MIAPGSLRGYEEVAGWDIFNRQVWDIYNRRPQPPGHHPPHTLSRARPFGRDLPDPTRRTFSPESARAVRVPVHGAGWAGAAPWRNRPPQGACRGSWRASLGRGRRSLLEATSAGTSWPRRPGRRQRTLHCALSRRSIPPLAGHSTRPSQGNPPAPRRQSTRPAPGIPPVPRRQSTRPAPRNPRVPRRARHSVPHRPPRAAPEEAGFGVSSAPGGTAFATRLTEPGTSSL